MTATTTTTTTTNDGGSSITKRPFAPPVALLPATRLRLYIDEIYELSKALQRSDVDDGRRYETLVQLNNLLSDNNRPNLFVNEKLPTTTTKALFGQITTGVSSRSQKLYRGDVNSGGGGGGGGNVLASLLNRADAERQWGMLQYQESQRAQANPIRAAFNFYTTQLEFGDSYLLTASLEDRKKMIREERLPALTNVVTADLDLRDLYRNQFLTALDDATAEVSYQVKNKKTNQSSNSNDDVSDAVEFLEQAHTTLTKWFDLIPPQDVRQALDTVLAQQEAQRKR